MRSSGVKNVWHINVSLEISCKFLILLSLKKNHFKFAVFIFGAIHEAYMMKDLEFILGSFQTVFSSQFFQILYLKVYVSLSQGG